MEDSFFYFFFEIYIKKGLISSSLKSEMKNWMNSECYKKNKNKKESFAKIWRVIKRLTCNEIRIGSLFCPLTHSSADNDGTQLAVAGKMSPWNCSDCKKEIKSGLMSRQSNKTNNVDQIFIKNIFIKSLNPM